MTTRLARRAREIRRSRKRTLVIASVVAAAMAAGPLAAQPVLADHEDEERWARATWVDDLNFLAANALLGGLTAGISSRLRGGSFSEAFARGALGGGVTYLGKRTAAARFDGAGLLGREVGAVGASIVRNAGLGIPVLDTLVLPLGPLRAFVPTGEPARARVRVDANDVAWLVSALAHDRLTLDWGESASAGAPVFRASGWLRARGDTASGQHSAGLVLVSDLPPVEVDDVLAHERAHLLQTDFFEIAVAYPLEDALGRWMGLDESPVLRAIVPGVAYYPVLAPFYGMKRSRSPLEVEADFLETR
ncbi:MAG TPA: hypothetical protein VK849_10800 [Longimicrobiales bacterium]|nr:hypothetical protein [Longimicrobiales bacterium]